MRAFAAAAALVMLAVVAQAAEPIAPTGSLRVAYLASNPVQARKDPQTGALTGISIDLAQELARRLSIPVVFDGQDIQGVMDAVRTGQADIGFLADEPSRRGPVIFSQTYLLNPQSIAVPEDSAIRAFADIDRPGLRVGGTRGDSVFLYLQRRLKAATPVEVPNASAEEARKAFAEGRIDAYAGSRQRLLGVVAAGGNLRILPGAIHVVPQAIIVAPERQAALAEINAFLNDVRSNGYLAASISRAANGTEMAPAP